VPDYALLRGEDARTGNGPGAAVNPGGVYRLPRGLLTPALFASMTVGMAQGLLDQWLAYTATRMSRGTKVADNPTSHVIAGECAAEIDAAEALNRDTITAAMKVLEAGGTLSDAELLRAKQNSAWACRTALEAGTRLFNTAGGTAIFKGGAVERRCCGTLRKHRKRRKPRDERRGADNRPALRALQNDHAAVTTRGAQLLQVDTGCECVAIPVADAFIGPHDIGIRDGLAAVFTSTDFGLHRGIVEPDPQLAFAFPAKQRIGDADIGRAILVMGDIDFDLLRRRHRDQAGHDGPVRADGFGAPVDEDLRRIDLAFFHGAPTGALAGRGIGRRERIVPADIIPVVDME
jgi:hypothetical protein